MSWWRIVKGLRDLVNKSGKTPYRANCGTLPHLLRSQSAHQLRANPKPFAPPDRLSIANLAPLLKLVAFVLFAWYDRFAPYVLAEKHNLKPMIDKQTFCYPLPIGKISQKEGNNGNKSNALN